MDNVVEMFSCFGDFQDGDAVSLSLISKYIDLGCFAKVQQILDESSERLKGKSCSGTKQIAQLLTAKITSSDASPWETSENESIIYILEHLMERLNGRSKSNINMSMSTNIFQCLFHLNKRILRRKDMWNYDVQEKLLNAIWNTPCSNDEISRSRKTTFFNAMYATTWNSMMEIHKENSADLNLEMIIMSLRWILLDSINHLPKLSKKLLKICTSTLLTDASDKLFEKLLLDICSDYMRVQKWANQLCGNQPDQTQVDLLTEFALAISELAIRCKDTPLALVAVEKVLDASIPYINHMVVNIIKTDLFIKMKKYSDALTFLSETLVKHPHVLNEHPGPFDLFDPPLMSCWSTQWVLVKTNSNNPDIEESTVYEFLHDKPDAADLLSKALLLELNAYFACRNVLSDGIASVGEHLEDVGRNECERALGLIAQAIGFWWDDGDTNERFCVSACERALQILNIQTEDDKENPQILIIAGIAKAWLAFSYCKRIYTTAKKDFSFIQEDIKVTNTNKSGHKSPELDIGTTEERIVPGITSININHEHEVGMLVTSCVDSLYTILHFDEAGTKKWFDICPALILLTARLCAYKISSLGDTYTSIRAWQVCNVLAKLYDRKYLQLLSGLEIYKQMPQSIRATIASLEELVQAGTESAGSYMPKTFFSRIHLVKSFICLKECQYEEGITYLAKVFNINDEKLNIDATHLVMAEAFFLLAHYRIAQESGKFNMDSIDDDLSELSPSALVIKSYKLCCGISREPNPSVSGWQDLCFDQHLLLVLLSHIPGTMKILLDAGNSRELLSYAADMVYLCQSLGFVSKTIEMLVPLADTDISIKSFTNCEQKIDAIYEMLTSSDISIGIHRVEMNQDEITKAMEKLELPHDENMCSPMPNLKIRLSTIKNSVNTNSDSNPNSPTLTSRTIRLPRFLFHGLSCSCYVCMHPTIIPSTIKFLHLAGRYAISGKDTKLGLSIFSMAKTHHKKACLRLLFHFERMCLRLAQTFHAKKVGRDALERAYLPFMLEPAFHLMYALIESTPTDDIAFTFNCCKIIQKGQTENEEGVLLTLRASLEISLAAVFEHYFVSDELLVDNSILRMCLTEKNLNKPMSQDEQ